MCSPILIFVRGNNFRKQGRNIKQATLHFDLFRTGPIGIRQRWFLSRIGEKEHHSSFIIIYVSTGFLLHSIDSGYTMSVVCVSQESDEIRNWGKLRHELYSKEHAAKPLEEYIQWTDNNERNTPCLSLDNGNSFQCCLTIVYAYQLLVTLRLRQSCLGCRLKAVVPKTLGLTGVTLNVS